MCGWFAARCDLILLLFDPYKLDISDEFKSVISTLRGHDDKVGHARRGSACLAAARKGRPLPCAQPVPGWRVVPGRTRSGTGAPHALPVGQHPSAAAAGPGCRRCGWC